MILIPRGHGRPDGVLMHNISCWTNADTAKDTGVCVGLSCVARHSNRSRFQTGRLGRKPRAAQAEQKAVVKMAAKQASGGVHGSMVQRYRPVK